MRIYKTLSVNFKSDLLFKDTLDFIEAAFEKLGIPYSDMGFMFSNGNIEKIVKKYPELQKYIITVDEYGREQSQSMSSARRDDNGNYTLRIPKKEHLFLHELVKKTPVPFSFGAISVYLDNVYWFPQIDTTPYLAGTNEMDTFPNAYYRHAYRSNHVVLIKQFDYGKKTNPVYLCIEAGDEKTGILDSSDIENKLSEAFGKPVESNGYSYCFSSEEKIQLSKWNREFLKTYEPLIKETVDMINHAQGIRDLKTLGAFQDPASPSLVSGLSLKKALRKAFSPKEYEHIFLGGSGSAYYVQKKNENNHTFGLFCDLSPSFTILSAGFFVSGYNFKFELDQADKDGIAVIYPNTQEEVEYHVENLHAALRKLETGLSGELFRLYGKSIG